MVIYIVICLCNIAHVSYPLSSLYTLLLYYLAESMSNTLITRASIEFVWKHGPRIYIISDSQGLKNYIIWMPKFPWKNPSMMSIIEKEGKFNRPLLYLSITNSKSEVMPAYISKDYLHIYIYMYIYDGSNKGEAPWNTQLL